jgi:YVTN family beta-propeller protein
VLNQLSVLTVIALSVSVIGYLGMRLALRYHLVPATAINTSSSPTFQLVANGMAADVPLGVASPSTTSVYQAIVAGAMAPAVAGVPERVYVPDSGGSTVEVIDPATYRLIGRINVGQVPYHVTPAWDLGSLYVDDDRSDTLTVIDPRTATIRATIPVQHPYNLYFTPDGSKAIVVAERLRRLEFRDPHTWTTIKSVDIPWPGVDHLDFSADGSYLLASTEFAGMVVKVDTVKMEVSGLLAVGGEPIDVRLAPDGATFYVANQQRNGVSVIEPDGMKEIAFISTGKGAHGLQISRDARLLYVSNRLAGSISVIDFATRKVVATWNVGGSPDMLQVAPLWASGRFDRAVYVISTSSGALLQRIPVGSQPHGLAYFPNVGRYSLGHNGVYR